jgi:hypothetical protein
VPNTFIVSPERSSAEKQITSPVLMHLRFFIKQSQFNCFTAFCHFVKEISF